MVKEFYCQLRIDSTLKFWRLVVQNEPTRSNRIDIQIIGRILKLVLFQIEHMEARGDLPPRRKVCDVISHNCTSHYAMPEV